MDQTTGALSLKNAINANALTLNLAWYCNFNDTKNDSRDSTRNLDSVSVSLANQAKLAFFNDRYPDLQRRISRMHKA